MACDIVPAGMQILLFFLPAALLAAPAGTDDFFETKIRPLLANKCFACHTEAKLGGLRLDSREAIVRGGKTGPAIVAGKPEESLLIQAVSRRHERLKMPPSDPLTETQVAELTAWVKMGAVWPSAPATAAAKEGGYVIGPEKRAFWSFQPIRKPGLPEVKNTSWARGPIDRFILAKLEQKGLNPMELADKATLIRRATFDLTGLPPTPDEVNAFVLDSSPGRSRKWSAVCWTRRGMANDGVATGSIWPAMPTEHSGPAKTRLTRTPTAIATGLSRRSIKTCRTTECWKHRLPRTSLRTRTKASIFLGLAFRRSAAIRTNDLM